MTFEEAKKLLKKEFMVIVFHKSAEPFEFDESRWFKNEKPSVLEAFRVLAKEGYYTAISLADYEEREARYKVHNDVVVQDLLKAASQFNDALLDEQAMKIKKQDGEITRLLSLVEKKENSISRLYYEKSVLEKENEELKKGEIPAKYFDKALVDEQAEKIKKLEHEKLDILEMASSCKQTVTQRGKEIARLNKIIHDKNEELKRKTKGCCELVTENVDLEKKLSDKDAVLSDVAEELRLSKIREKNLTEVCQKYMKENEELKKELADKVVDKIDAQALKSAESALAYKDSYIEKLKNKKVINNRASMEAIAKYVDAVSKAELDGLVLESWKNDGKEITSVYQLKNGKRYTLSLVYTGEEFLFYKTDLDKKPHISTPEISQEELMKIQEKVVASCDIAEEGGDHSAIIVQCYKDITTISKDEAEIIERCTKNGTELHYSEKDGFTYTNVFGEEMPIRCLRGIFHVFTDEEIKNMKK